MRPEDHLAYTSATISGRPLMMTLPTGQVLPGTMAALPVMHYPVRMAPWVEDTWEILYSHTEPRQPPTPTYSVADAWSKAYELSVNPSFGLNGVFLGGHKDYDGFVGDRPNMNAHVAFYGSDVRHPSRMIAFGESQMRGGGASGEVGFHTLTPPVLKGRLWRAAAQPDEVNGGFEITSLSLLGLPQGRYDRRAIIGWRDTHAEGMTPAELDNMTLWAPRADAADYDYAAP